MLNYLVGGNDRDDRRTLGTNDREHLWRSANKRCQNPKCNRKLEFTQMQVGHKTAWSKGGRTTLANSVCLCYECNHLQGRDSWATFLKKLGVEDPKAKEKKAIKQSLEALSISQLKFLAKKHSVKVEGEIKEGDYFTAPRKIAPSKSKYVSKLSKVLTEQQLRSLPKKTPKTAKKKKKGTTTYFSLARGYFTK